MGQIIWLASYPKSGNTWMRMLLNTYFHSDTERQNLNSLDLSTYGGSSKSSYRAVTSTDVDTMSDDDIAKLTPNAHTHIASRHQDAVFVKTHNMLSTYKGTSLITPSVTRGGIYIIRNPLDTVLSVADHFGLSLDRAIDLMNSMNGSTAPTDQVVRQYFGSWSHNVLTWTTEIPFAVCPVRYEDLHSAPGKSFENILSFFDFEIDRKKIAKTVKKTSFKALKSMEKRDGFSEKSEHSKAFFRSGKTGQWKSKLSEAQIERLVTPNYVQMKRFGYLPAGY
jgi:Sulfotransferase domain